MTSITRPGDPFAGRHRFTRAPRDYSGVRVALQVIGLAAVVFIVMAAPAWASVRGPHVTVTRTITDPGTLTVHVSHLPACLRNPEADAETASSTPDSPGPAEWGLRHGKIPAGGSFTVRIRFAPRWDPPGQWDVFMVAGYSCATGATVTYPVDVPFTVRP